MTPAAPKMSATPASRLLEPLGQRLVASIRHILPSRRVLHV